MEKFTCCKIDCDAIAEWHIWDGKHPEFDHYVLACTEHVGDLLTDAPEHKIYPLQPVPEGPGQ